MVGESVMTLAELIARENPVRHCQECGTQFTDGDFVDYYCKLCSTIDRREMGEVCQSCFAKWEDAAGTPLRRYSKPSKDRLCVCVPCGMMFSSTSNFDRHRRGMRCNSPTEMMAKKTPMVVKDGIWTLETDCEWHLKSSGLS